MSTASCIRQRLVQTAVSNKKEVKGGGKGGELAEEMQSFVDIYLKRISRMLMPLRSFYQFSTHYFQSFRRRFIEEGGLPSSLSN